MRRGELIVAAAAMALAVLLMLVVMPRVTGVGWDDSSDRVASVPLPQIWQLVAVWAVGLWLHTFVLQASLPGLGTRRALALNLGGSGISNVLPFGGAAGVGLNYAMLRSWGYSQIEISAFVTVSNAVVAVVKVLIAVGGAIALSTMPSVATGAPLRPSRTVELAALLVLGAVTGAVAAMATSVRTRARVRALGSATRRAMAAMAHVLRSGWRLITLGGVGYPALQALLLCLCVRSAGGTVTVIACLAAYAVERLLTLVPLTPGGVGFVETAATATLVAFGTDATAAAAGVILFRLFTYFVEIPLGGVVTMLWLAGRRNGRRAT
jgi:uncharacterized membrane protein YbhN (UPF0104 family)